MTDDTQSPQIPQTDAAVWRRLGLEAGPLVVFFVANQIWEIFTATALFMGAMIIAVAASWRLERRVPIMPVVSCAFVVLFGGLTLALENDLFIKLKPTIVNLLFAAILFVGLASRKTYLKLVLGAVMHLTDRGWTVLTWRWAFFFIVLAILNEIVWRSFSTDFWAGFKLFGIMPLTLMFAAAQMPLILKEQVEPPKPAE